MTILKQVLVFLLPNPRQARERRLMRTGRRAYSPVYTCLIGKAR